MAKIDVFQDDNANWTFIVGTDDPVEAEKALRKAEETWFTDVELPEMRMDFAAFSPANIYSRGEFVHFDKGGLPKGKGRISVKDGFIAPIE